MEDLITPRINNIRRERLINPQVSDHFKTLLATKYGNYVYEVKVGRKWVFLKSKSHRLRLTIKDYKILGYNNWLSDCKSDVFFNEVAKDSYKHPFKFPRQWWLQYGFESKP